MSGERETSTDLATYLLYMVPNRGLIKAEALSRLAPNVTE